MSFELIEAEVRTSRLLTFCRPWRCVNFGADIGMAVLG